MEKLLEILKKSFEITENKAFILKNLSSKITVNDKDIEIIEHLIKYKLDFYSIIAYLVCEKNIFEEKECYNDDILNIAKNLKYLEENSSYTNKQEEAEILRKQFVAMCQDIRVIIIKLCLVLYDANKCSLPLSAENKDLLLTIRNIYAPLSERLGLNSLKSVLEDLCLKNLDTEIYQELESSVLLKKEENAKQIDLTKSKLEYILKELNITNGVIMARQKHFSSIYKKIKFKNVPLAKIYDLIAMRVIVNNIDECYAVLGKIHGIYRPMEGRFKDYISNPKPNGYQSLHTTIIAENERPLEIQIRTFEMHKNSEFGVDVAHWIYKEKRKTTDFDKKLVWLREIMDSSENLSSEEFVETLKTNLYSGRIFVQTPKGKVIEFPEGSCVIDFAYAIHSDIGNSCVGGKVNGKMVPLSTKLSNNDIVEIVTSPTTKGPSRDWLSIVKTAGARSKINAFYKKEFKEDNIKNGKQIIELALKDKGLPINKILTEKILESVIFKYAFNTAEEMFAALGHGSLSSHQVINKLIQEFEKENPQTVQKEKISTIVVKKNKDGVLVDGDSGMMIRYAGCCNPILGEDIIGYISRGRGVTIHKCDCNNLKYLEQERLINASWSEKNIDYKVYNLSLVANQTDDVITKITQTVSHLNYNIIGLETKFFADKLLCNIKIKLPKNADADKLEKTLLKLDNILEVKKI